MIYNAFSNFTGELVRIRKIKGSDLLKVTLSSGGFTFVKAGENYRSHFTMLNAKPTLMERANHSFSGLSALDASSR